ncbi:MAG: histidine phosphatase family protein [Thermoplasmata archaeon]
MAVRVLMARLVLVRHGHPVAGGRERSRWRLSDQGRTAVAKLSEEAVWETVERIYASPERRAQETAQIVANRWDLPVKVREDLGEVRRPFEVRGYEDKIRAFLKGRAPEGWESRQGAEARVSEAMEEISGGRVDVAAVSHALLLALFLAQVSRAEPTFWLHHSIGFAEYALYDTDARGLVQDFRAAGAKAAE